MDTNLTSHAQLAVQINPTCVGLWFLPNLPQKPTKHSVRFHRSICGFHWRYLGASRHLTSSQASQVPQSSQLHRLHRWPVFELARDFDTVRSMLGGVQCTFFLFSSFLFRVYWPAVIVPEILTRREVWEAIMHIFLSNWLSLKAHKSALTLEGRPQQ